MSYFIEHPTKGILMDLDSDGTMKWAWSKPRSEARMWPSIHVVKTIRPLIPERLRSACWVMRYTPGRGLRLSKYETIGKLDGL